MTLKYMGLSNYSRMYDLV